MPGIVPADDLPDSPGSKIVPADDLPGAVTASTDQPGPPVAPREGFLQPLTGCV